MACRSSPLTLRAIDGCGTGDRRRHDGRRATSLELNDSSALDFNSIANCEFSGKSHSKYIYGRFR
jgi:hypothetical protein